MLAQFLYLTSNFIKGLPILSEIGSFDIYSENLKLLTTLEKNNFRFRVLSLSSEVIVLRSVNFILSFILFNSKRKIYLFHRTLSETVFMKFVMAFWFGFFLIVRQNISIVTCTSFCFSQFCFWKTGFKFWFFLLSLRELCS